MLTQTDLMTGRRAVRPQPSLRQQYQEYLMQRIEAYKNSLPREDLLRLGDEAATELQAATEGQFPLTEVLMLETVDQLIIQRLGLGSYRRWKGRLIKLRAAQREPTHWSLPSRHPVAQLVPRLESGDHVITVGGGAEASACLLAAWEVPVTFLAGTLSTVEQVETRIAGESLGTQFQAYVAQLGEWLPSLDPACLVVLDASTLAELQAGQRRRLLHALQEVTLPCGLHLLIPGKQGAAPEGYLSHYARWERLPIADARLGNEGHALLLCAPAETEQQGRTSSAASHRASR